MWKHWFCRPSDATQHERLPVYTAIDHSNTSCLLEKPSSFVSNAPEDTIEQTIDGLSNELRDLSMRLWHKPELAWHEFYASKEAADFMEKHGFKVTYPAYGIETAFEAVFEHKSGGKVVGFNSEYDALARIGQACGHNLICISGIASAIATAQALVKQDVAGKVILLGTPAEETDGGKIKLLKAGAYKQMDACLMLHPAPMGGLVKMLAISEVRCEFFGKGAHAAGAPWEGINALDAAVSVYNSLSTLRQQTLPTSRIHLIIKTRPDQPVNVIPDYAEMFVTARLLDKTIEYSDLEKLKAKVEAAIKAACEVTGCTHKASWQYTYQDVRQNITLGEEYTRYMKERQDVIFPPDASSTAFGSTDFGNVCYALPAIHPFVKIPTEPGSGNHTPGFTQAAKTMEAHVETLKGSKGLAAVAWKILTDGKFLDQVKKSFEEDKKHR